MVAIIASNIHPDEPCFGLYEGPDHGRWVQKVFVIRSDSIARYQTDLGPEENYSRITPLLMPSQGDDTVAQLQVFAEKNRHDTHWADRRDEMLSESTLVEDHLRLLDEETKQLLNKSVFGPSVTVQRNHIPRDSATRALKERVNGSRTANP